MPLTIETVTTFVGWCVVINSAVLLMTTLVLYFGRNWIPSFHAKLFDISENTVRAEHLAFLSNYKRLTLFFSLVPYVALKLVQ